MDAKPIDLALRRADALCHERGVRLTPQRRRVLEILCAAERPLGAYEILDAMRVGNRSLAPPTVYRALDFLLEQGLVHKLESRHAFVGCTHPEHPHSCQFLICADCGLVTEVEDAAVAESLASVAAASGFRAERPVVELIGTCADCVRKRH
ncbi:Fur family transcriptional regulator [Thiorhodococcus minor]|uniref:Ferric uptake regulation protein n=1 Tax=Thiorhodococcus minor TaxID=57489 RepID=A0A6M0K4A0_9GAMM|nr:transcriptional repressor [Thiorhodococcus minor]NEV63417.1 transcriptional repressor [Thiorhodococcus minor]